MYLSVGGCQRGLKKKIQAVLTEMNRIILNDYHSSTRVVHEKLGALSLDGWIQYMDVMSGRSITDHIKPQDMAKKTQHFQTPNTEQQEISSTQLELIKLPSTLEKLLTKVHQNLHKDPKEHHIS